VAACVLKQVQYLHDVNGRDGQIHYAKTRHWKEIDFVIAGDGSPEALIEVKRSETDPSRGLSHFANRFPEPISVHLAHHLRQEETREKVHIRRAADWLASLDASKKENRLVRPIPAASWAYDGCFRRLFAKNDDVCLR
jgi:hypothetical protein